MGCTRVYRELVSVCVLTGSSVSLGADLLSIYDDTRRSLGVDVAQSCAAAADYDYIDNVDGDCVEMLPAEEHSNSASDSSTVGSTRSPDRQTAAAAAFQRGYSDVDERTCKRPLSVSSTSSSMSSTSSLPRHERKKLATAVQSALPDVEDASPGYRDGEAGCLSTVVEYVPAAAERCRCADDERLSQAGSSVYDIGVEVESSSAAARGGDDNDDEDDAGVGGTTTTTLSRSQYVGRVVAEIIDTERAYVADLHQIIHVCVTSTLCRLYTTPWERYDVDQVGHG